MKLTKIDIAFFGLPIVMWPIVFITFSSHFVYAMLVASLILAAFSLARYRKYIRWTRSKIPVAVAVGAAASILLYLGFYFGYFLTSHLGLHGDVTNVYSMINSQAGTFEIMVMLAFIGISEEIYWRGALQGYVEKNSGSSLLMKYPWIASTVYYGSAHFLSLNPVLAMGAFFEGFISSTIAQRYGISASIIAHIIWIEAFIVFLPVIIA